MRLRTSRTLTVFVDREQKKKVVVLEELAGEFGMKTQDAIDRVTKLEAMGRITGVIDDRGKFVFITPEEMTKVCVCCECSSVCKRGREREREREKREAFVRVSQRWLGRDTTLFTVAGVLSLSSRWRGLSHGEAGSAKPISLLSRTS
jgi:hypothetical protein